MTLALLDLFRTWSHKISTSVHFLCDIVLRTLLHVLPQFKEKCPLSGAKTQVKYVKPWHIFIRRYRYILLCFYYAATEMYCGGAELKYPGSVPKSECSFMPYTKPNPKHTQ